MLLNYVCLWLLLLVPGSQATSCQDTGEWAEWGDWSACPNSGMELMNFQRRVRQCEARPVGCTVTTSYKCPGNYSEVRYCTTTTTSTTTLAPTTEAMEVSEASTAADVPSTEMEPSSDGPSTEQQNLPTETEPTPAEVPTSEIFDMSTTEAGQAETEMPTTSRTRVTCDDCPELDVHIYANEPFEDASSVLNRYHIRGCRYVDFVCRSSEKNDTRPVRTIFDGQSDRRGLPNHAQFACQNGLWVEQSLQDPVSSLSCVYDPPPTTTTPTTTTPRTTTPTTTPSTTTFDPNDPCFNCSYLVVSPPSNVKEGYTYLDHTSGQCLTVQVFCRPLENGERVDLLIDNISFGLTGTAVNRTFQCNHDQQWLDQETQEVVDSVACAIISNEMTDATTIAAEETTQLLETTSGGQEEETTPSGVGSTSEQEEGSTGMATIYEERTTEIRLEETTPAGGSTEAQEEITLPSGGSTEGEEETSAVPGGESTPGEEQESTEKPGDGSTETPEGSSTAEQEATKEAAGGSTGEQEEASTVPGGSTAGEEETSAAPRGSTIEQEGSTGGVEGSTSEQQETSAAPGGSTLEQERTSEGSTSEQEATSEAPGGSTIEQEGSTELPGGSTAEQGETSAVPGGSTAVQGETSAAPGGSTVEQEGTTEAAGGSTSEQEGTSAAPGGSTIEQEATSVEGSGSTSEQGETSAAPGGSTMEQEGSEGTTPSQEESSVIPEGSTPGEGGTSAAPGGSTAEQEGTSEESGGSTAKQEGTSAVPGGSTAEQGETSALPEGSTPGQEGETGVTEVSGGSTAAQEGTSAVPGESSPSQEETNGATGVMEHSTTPAMEGSTGETAAQEETSAVPSQGSTPAMEESTPAQEGSTGGASETVAQEEPSTVQGGSSMEGSTPAENETTAAQSGSSVSEASGASSMAPTPGQEESTPAHEEPSTEATEEHTPAIDNTLEMTSPTAEQGETSTEMTTPGFDPGEEVTTVMVSEATTTTLSTTATIPAGVPTTTLPTGSITSTTPLTTMTGEISTTTGLTTTSATNVACGHCPNMEPIPAPTSANTYNGMIVLDHYTNASGCRNLDVYCSPNPGDNATITFSDNSVAASGPGEQKLAMFCTPQSTWVFNGHSITTAQCMGSTIPAELKPTTLVPPEPTTTTTAAPTTTNPNIPACKQCGRLVVKQTTEEGWRNGLTTLVSDQTKDCNLIQLSCAGTQDTDDVLLLMGGQTLASGKGKLQVDFVCDDVAQWTTNDAKRTIVPEVSCAIPPVVTSTTLEPTTSTSTTTTSTSTTTTMTTTTPTLCGKCPNMEAAEPPSLGANEGTGMLVLDHFYEFPSNCRVVVVRCKGTSEHDNMTILFDGTTESATTPLQVSTSLICSADGAWRRLGQDITNVACKAKMPPPDVTFPPTVPTTTTVAITTTSPGEVPRPACQRCSPSPATSVPSGYKSGFLTADATNPPNTCLLVIMSCAAPTAGDSVALFSATGSTIASGVSRVNLTISCNDASKWETSDKTVIDSVSCGVLADQTTTETPARIEPEVTTTLTPAADDCSKVVWEEWRSWSDCTDYCGGCGTHQRFRACLKDKSKPDCGCEGSQYEKDYCGMDVCRYPRNESCCGQHKPKSSKGKFQCVLDKTLVTQAP